MEILLYLYFADICIYFSDSLFYFWQVANNFIFINETFALLLLIGSVIAKWTQSNKIQGIIFFLLFIPLFNLLSYSYTIKDGDATTTYHSAHFNSLVNPIVFLLFIVYAAFNTFFIKKQLQSVFKGSDQEIKMKNNSEVDFYYAKFNSSTDDELRGFYKMYKAYPDTAKLALDKIKEERNLRVDVLK